ncbi:MAG: hypothetical protein AAF483_19520 [Planctomycetota bacterium]
MQFGTKLTLAAALLAFCSLTSSANAQQYGNGPQLFANQYSNGANQATAQMYLSPVPVPAWVGHTYYTYQPLYPHHYMHPHSDRFHNYYDGGRGLNRTRVHYSTAPLRTAIQSFWSSGLIPRR